MYGVAETVANRIPSVEEYIGAVPALAIVPFFFAGSLFPITAMPRVLTAFARVLPLTHALAVMRYGLLGAQRDRAARHLGHEQRHRDGRAQPRRRRAVRDRAHVRRPPHVPARGGLVTPLTGVSTPADAVWSDAGFALQDRDPARREVLVADATWHLLCGAPLWCQSGAMKLEPYVEEIQQHVALAAEAGGYDASALAGRLMAPLDAAVGSRWSTPR